MVELNEVKTYNDVNTGDALAYVEQDGKETVVYKLSENMVGVILHLVQIHILEEVTIRIAIYDSPLRQRVLKTVKIS